LILKLDSSNHIKKLISEINSLGEKLTQTINIMEICGTHTMSIGKNGLRQIIPENINLISGPGCPVCVTPINEIDQIIDLSTSKNIVLFTFGDMLRVPGSKTTLYKKRSEGSEIRICYSPNEPLKFADQNPDKNIVFVAIGFETTAPLTAAIIKNAASKKLKNFFVYNLHKTVPGAISYLLKQDKILKLDAFICPGHVCTITGSKPFKFISDSYGKPAVISGFSAEDILESIMMILKQIIQKNPHTVIQYLLAVKESGNIFAQNLIDEVFEHTSSYWRGIGLIEYSGLGIKEKYRDFDAKKVFKISLNKNKEPKYCDCGKILLGEKKPFECALFGNKCNPENPIGPCMVSSEGTCAAYYKYEKIERNGF
jgi:hydrogenase expression/formation protein HypD